MLKFYRIMEKIIIIVYISGSFFQSIGILYNYNKMFRLFFIVTLFVLELYFITETGLRIYKRLGYNDNNLKIYIIEIITMLISFLFLTFPDLLYIILKKCNYNELNISLIRLVMINRILSVELIKKIYGYIYKKLKSGLHNNFIYYLKLKNIIIIYSVVIINLLITGILSMSTGYTNTTMLTARKYKIIKMINRITTYSKRNKTDIDEKLNEYFGGTEDIIKVYKEDGTILFDREIEKRFVNVFEKDLVSFKYFNLNIMFSKLFIIKIHKTFLIYLFFILLLFIYINTAFSLYDKIKGLSKKPKDFWTNPIL